MGAAATVPLSQTVAPGATIDVSVTMVAPTVSKSYTGYWMLQNAAGARFGTGASGAGTFYVNIAVGGGATITGTPYTATPNATPAIFAVFASSLSASPSTYSGGCPVTINFTGSLSASKAGTVTYHFIRSDGSTFGKTEVFSTAGTQAITDS